MRWYSTSGTGLRIMGHTDQHLPALRLADLDEPSSPQWNDFDYYRNYLTFSQLTHWDEFVDAFINGE